MNGRTACLYVSADAYTASGLKLVTRSKDIDFPDEAEDIKAEARDLAYAVHSAGIKDASISFSRLLEANDSAEALTVLRNAYDAGTDLYCVVTRKPKAVASGKAKRFVGKVIQFAEKYPENGPATVDVKIVPSDPDHLPERVDTPLS